MLDASGEAKGEEGAPEGGREESDGLHTQAPGFWRVERMPHARPSGHDVAGVFYRACRPSGGQPVAVRLREGESHAGRQEHRPCHIPLADEIVIR